MYRECNTSLFRSSLALLTIVAGLSSFCGCGYRKPATPEQKITAGQGVVSSEETKDALDNLSAIVKPQMGKTIEANAILPAIESGRYFANIAAQSARMTSTDFGPPDVPVTLAPPPAQNEPPDTTAQREHDQASRDQAQDDSNHNDIDPAQAVKGGFDLLTYILATLATGGVGGAGLLALRLQKASNIATSIVGYVSEAFKTNPSSAQVIKTSLDRAMPDDLKAEVKLHEAKWASIPEDRGAQAIPAAVEPPNLPFDVIKISPPDPAKPAA